MMKEAPTKDNVQKLARDLKAENERFFKQLKKKPPKNLDELVQALHDEAFEKIRRSSYFAGFGSTRYGA